MSFGTNGYQSQDCIVTGWHDCAVPGHLLGTSTYAGCCFHGIGSQMFYHTEVMGLGWPHDLLIISLVQYWVRFLCVSISLLEAGSYLYKLHIFISWLSVDMSLLADFGMITQFVVSYMNEHAQHVPFVAWCSLHDVHSTTQPFPGISVTHARGVTASGVTSPAIMNCVIWSAKMH